MSSKKNHEEDPRYSYFNQNNGSSIAGLRIFHGLRDVPRKRLRNACSKSLNL
ncbi:hypothetical protein CHRYSEO8AT_260049 [Chryseobacterium sp. 8AT]|nr:hypothetical protein CHRYSEO8AT_260049 [Chryseobacterium sp. 8AT]